MVDAINIYDFIRISVQKELTMQNDPKSLAAAWIESWNNRDLDKVMDHYADDVELSSPFVRDRWKIEEGKLTGKEMLRKHFAKGFEGPPSNPRKLFEVLNGVSGFIVIYQNDKGIMSADAVELNKEGKVKSVKAFYEE